MRRRSAVHAVLLLILWLGMDSAGDFVADAQQPLTRHLVDSEQPPFSSVGKLKGEMTCSAAAVIDPRIIVTAGHCVISREKPAVLALVAFQSSHPLDVRPIDGRVARLGLDTSLRDRTAPDEADDWAIVVLDAAPPGLQPLGLRVLSRVEFEELRGRVTLPSYSADVAGGALLSAVERCSIGDVRWNVLIHDCPCAKGSSGAPLVIADGDWYALVGINSAMLYPADREGPERILHAAVSASSFETALRDVVASLNDSPTPGQHTALERQP